MNTKSSLLEVSFDALDHQTEMWKKWLISYVHPIWTPLKMFGGWQEKSVEIIVNSKQFIFTNFNNIPVNLLQTLILTMPKQIFEFIHNDGCTIHYWDVFLGISYFL